MTDQKHHNRELAIDELNQVTGGTDAKLKPIFGAADKVTMFEMNKYLSTHLSK